MKVLVVEDNPAVVRLLQQSLEESGYDVHIEVDGARGLTSAQKESYDLILLDVMLPLMDGFTICRRLRDEGSRVPVLMITARDTTEDKVAGLDAGADDYIVKPFQVSELMARMRALLRRSTPYPVLLQVGDLTLDPASRKAQRNGKTISLSATEYSLLEFLMRHTGKTLTRAQILDHVWQYDFGGNDNVLDCYISYLRQKIDKGQKVRLIHTARGVGFRMGIE